LHLGAEGGLRLAFDLMLARADDVVEGARATP
jgi:hypothetical protein